MKIVIVLCSLATFAIAVPVYQENVFDSSLSNQASSIKRERKSAFPEIKPGLFAEHGIEKIPIHSSKKSGQGTSLEAKSFRRPIIIKRKLGYHVYRDSDEEMAYAEPGEKCREQVKFKLCDHEPVSSSKNGFKSPTFKCLNSHSTNNEMENSIKMAKEAVEHLQKDLKRMENFSAKVVNPNIEDIESNTGLHHDIEIAREALEHIEQNFESVNLEVNKVNDLQIPKSQDEERLTRWREAIENIHKNFEIVKNIEDAFKSDNHLSLFRSESVKAVESEEPEHSEGHDFVEHKFTNDNLENNDEVYNEDKILKAAPSEDEIVQLTPKTENVDNIGKDAGNDMFVSPTENREEKIHLHSDSLKSEISYKDTSLRSDVSEIESTKHDTNFPKESIEYALKTSNSLSESNPESWNEKNPLERLSSMSKSTIIENSKSSEAGGEENKYFDKNNNKASENQENKSKPYNMDMRLSNDQLEKTEQLSADNFDTIDQYLIQSPHLLSLKEKNVFSGEGNVQNDYNHKIKGSHEFQDSLKDSKVEVEDEAHNFKYTDEYKNMKSSEIQDWQIGSSKNQELNKFSFVNDDSLKKADQNEPQLYKTVSAASNEHISNDRDKFANQYNTEEEMSMTQNKDANEDPKWKFSESNPELYSDPMLSMQREIVDKSDDQHSHKSQASMRLSQTETEKLQSNEYHEGAEQESMKFDIENSSDDSKKQFLKSVPELQPYPKALLPTDKKDNTNDQQAHGEDASMRASENQIEKMQPNEYQEVHEPLPIGLEIERHPEESAWKFPKSVPELPFDLMVSMPKEKVDISDNQHAHTEEVRTSENQNDKMQLDENKEVHEPLPMELDVERHPEERTWEYSKSVPELPFDPMASTPTDKVDITDDQHEYKGEESMRSSENQNDKMILNNNQEVQEHLPIGLDAERHPEERTWEYSKSVPELPFDPMASTPTDKVDITDDQHEYKGEESMRSSENQNDKMIFNNNQEVQEHLPIGLDIEHHPVERSWQYSKSVPELQRYPLSSLPLDKVDIANDKLSYSGEASMRSAENQNDKMQSNENQEVREPLSTGLDIERHPEEHSGQYSKSVPEPQLHPRTSFPLDKEVITNDQQSHSGEASMRSAENGNEKIKFDEIQEVPPMGVDIERHPEEHTWQLSKSVPELLYNPMVSMPTENVDVTDDQHFHDRQASMRMSHTQNEKLQSKDYQEESEHSSTRLDTENESDDTKTKFSKSVPEEESHPIASFPSDKVETTNNLHLQGEEASIKSADDQNDENLSNENQEVHHSLPIGLDTERHPEERTWQYSEDVPEMPHDSMISMEKVDITADQHAHKVEASSKSSESQSEKLQLNKNQENPEHTAMILNIENNSIDSESQVFKSVSELQLYPIASLPSDKVDITNDQQSYREEASMRSSESQNDKIPSNEYQEVHEPLPMASDIERHPDERTWQYFKSVPEVPNDPMISMTTEKIDITDDQHAPKGEETMRSSENQNGKMQLNVNIENNSDDTKTQFLKSVSELQPTDKVDITNDQQSHREEATMRSSESQNNKMQSHENQEVHEPLPMALDIERHPEERPWQYSKSVPELSYDPIVSRPTEQVDITDDQHAHKGEVSMKTSEIQNDKMQSNENQELHTLPSGLDIERHPEERTLQYSKSVPEPFYDTMVATPTDKVDITDDQHEYKGEESMRSSENQNDKMQSNGNQELYEPLSTGLDIDPDERSWQYSKSVPELQLYPIASLPLDKVDITNDQQSHSGAASMRSAEIPNLKNKLDETQEVHEPLTMGLDPERHSEESTLQYSKSVPELVYDSTVLGNIDITNDQNYEGDASMRVSETQNEKLQLNDYKEEPEHLSTKFVLENKVENQKPQFLKSVPELTTDSLISLSTDKVDINNYQYSDKEKAGMRLTQTQNEKLQLDEIKEAQAPLIMRLDMTNHPQDRKWQFSKSVPELPYDPMVSMPTDNVEIINEQQPLNEGNMRLSQNENKRTQFHESQRLQEFFPTKLGIENDLEHSQVFKFAPEPYMTRSNINHANNENFYFPEDARLSQNQNERQEIYFNQHYYEPLSSKLDKEKKLEDDSLSANTVRFSYQPNPMKEQTNVRLSQNENENIEIQYPSTSFGLSNEHMNNAEHIINDNMHLSEAQHQQLHENRNSMLRSSNERQRLNHNYNSWPEYKMLPSTSQFELRNGQNLLNERTNMRINEQQSRDPEPTENQNLHNSLSMLWNTENQHQDPSPKTFKSNSDFDHTLHKSNEYDNQQFIPQEVSIPRNTLEYRTRPQLFDDHILDDTQSSGWYQTKQQNDHFANYYKSIPEMHEEHMNPHFRKHLHRVAVNHKLNDADTFSSYDFPSSRHHDHMQKYHQEKSSNIDSSMESGMHMNMREPFAKSGTEFHNMHFNHPHGTARFGAALPIAGVNSGAVGVFPTANAGGCGIPLLLSCSPSVVSGSLARQHIAGPVFKSVDENFKYYMKRDAKNIADVQDIKIQKASFPHHGTGATSEI